ncbi:LacI family transcriptional regulator [Novosphingobium fuchskuhlense]|uniref:LacI family transcriptional regulator n=1 Tax=Novosphingobium fuchskuhlense TaxID=1117702 RepID=A0A117UXC5_9SPHN|nr:substrate-binding domain-containing protein [Novosphingobium fuchskuhlense]KUR72582.1 LacI family transcriptional regulator [Novosphingobium fuchskuhlense]
MNAPKTLKELAEIAGVTSGTVSRALSGSNLVTPATRDMIVALARQHGFTPNATARNLRMRKTNTIGVVIPLGHEVRQNISDPFFITLLGLLADKLTARGYSLLLSRVVPTDEDWLLKLARSGQSDGIIVIGQSDQSAVLDRVAELYRPLVVWGSHIAGQAHCSVGSDNFRGGALAAQHLIERGCRNIVFFGDPRAIEIGQRLEGCRSVVEKAGIPFGIVPTHLVADEAQSEIGKYFRAKAHRPDGVVAASDVIAVTALRVLTEQGLSVPADVKVIGYDGLQLGEHTMPPLTTIAQDLEQGADSLVSSVVQRIAGEEIHSVILQPRLLVRQST